MKALKFLWELALSLIALAALAFLVLAIIAPEAWAAGTTARLSWQHPTTRIDGSTLPVAQIRETLIEWRRTAAGPVVGTLAVTAPATSVDVPGLVCGDFVFSARTVAVDTSQSSAATTNYATGITCSPNPPTGFTAN